MTDEELLAHEIECHQFTEPLKPPAKPPSLAKRAVVRATSGKVWFRVGWTCGCVKAVLETAEKEMLLRGLIQDSLDIYQLQGSAAASAGTHSLPGAYDIAQYSDAQIDVQRLCGGDGQHRTRAQGFSADHCHGFAQGCPHGSSGLLYQKRAWNNGRNGLVSNGRIAGRWPTKNWKTAVAERTKVIMALADDIAEKAADKVVARLAPLINGIPGKTIHGVGINVSADPKKKVYWALDHIGSWLVRLLGPLNTRVNALDAKVDALVKGQQK